MEQIDEDRVGTTGNPVIEHLLDNDMNKNENDGEESSFRIKRTFISWQDRKQSNEGLKGKSMSMPQSIPDYHFNVSLRRQIIAVLYKPTLDNNKYHHLPQVEEVLKDVINFEQDTQPNTISEDEVFDNSVEQDHGISDVIKSIDGTSLNSLQPMSLEGSDLNFDSKNSTRRISLSPSEYKGKQNNRRGAEPTRSLSGRLDMEPSYPGAQLEYCIEHFRAARNDSDGTLCESVKKNKDIGKNSACNTEGIDAELLAKIPYNEDGVLMSVGSIKHAEGLCRPCVFYHREEKPCTNGLRCTFCHFTHEPKKRVRKSRKHKAASQANNEVKKEPQNSSKSNNTETTMEKCFLEGKSNVMPAEIIPRTNRYYVQPESVLCKCVLLQTLSTPYANSIEYPFYPIVNQEWYCPNISRSTVDKPCRQRRRDVYAVRQPFFHDSIASRFW